jgi:hypothetical protein
MMSVQVAPSGEYSSFTVGMVPTVVQLIVTPSPTVKAWPAVGAVTDKSPWIVKNALEMSVRVGAPVSVTRIFTLVEIESGTVHG